MPDFNPQTVNRLAGTAERFSEPVHHVEKFRESIYRIDEKQTRRAWQYRGRTDDGQRRECLP